MKCGSKCFIVEMEVQGEKQTKPIIARTPVEVRKSIRKEHGERVHIISVKEEKKK